MTRFNIEDIFPVLSRMSKSERKELIATQNSHGLGIRDIECYTYPEDPGIKHLFFHFRDRKETVPYYLLDDEFLEHIQDCVSQNVSI